MTAPREPNLNSIIHSVIESINHVSLPSEMTKDDVKQFEKLTSLWSGLSVQLHVLDFKEVNKLHISFYASAIQFRKRIESPTCKMISINISDNLLEKMRDQGVEKAIGHLKNINVLKKTKSEDSGADARTWVAKYLLDSTRKAMETMFKTTVSADDKFKDTMKNLKPERFSHIAAVSSVGPVLQATFRLYFERNVLEKFVRASLPDETNIQPELLSSTATELLNVTFATAKSKLNDDRGYQMPGGIPTLIGPVEAMTNRRGHWRDTRVIPMFTPLGEYYLEIEYHTLPDSTSTQKSGPT